MMGLQIMGSAEGTWVSPIGEELQPVDSIRLSSRAANNGHPGGCAWMLPMHVQAPPLQPSQRASCTFQPHWPSLVTSASATIKSKEKFLDDWRQPSSANRKSWRRPMSWGVETEEPYPLQIPHGIRDGLQEGHSDIMGRVSLQGATEENFGQAQEVPISLGISRHPKYQRK